MSIEDSLASIAVSLAAITAHLTGAPAPAAEPAKKGPGRPAGAVNKPTAETLGAAAVTAEAAKARTLPEVSARITDLIAKGKRDEVLALIATCGGTKASTIPPANYPKFFAECDKLDTAAADPAG